MIIQIYACIHIEHNKAGNWVLVHKSQLELLTLFLLDYHCSTSFIELKGN